jgi:hypothetical protein
MKFDSYFQLTSYAVVACGAIALLASGGIGWFVTAIFAFALCAAWRLEKTKWQFSERFGLVLIVLALPLYYLDWQYQLATYPTERAGAATLAHLILGLSVIKLFQIKSDRDWIFLYLISFFEVLLAAGLSISPLFLATLILYLLFAVCTIIAFEIRKSGRQVVLLASADEAQKPGLGWRLPLAAVWVLVLISLFAAPLFLMMPRVGGAGFGGNGGGVSGLQIGFSDRVRLGTIGSLQQSNEVVMRVRVDNPQTALKRDLRWRGTALDTFDNQSWSNSRRFDKYAVTSQTGWYQFGQVKKAEDVTVQTVYLEPLDTPVLFGATRIVGLQGGFPTVLRDADEGFSMPRNFERTVYKVFSDTAAPDAANLRLDNAVYSEQIKKHYLQLPANLDKRIVTLARDIVRLSGATNRYDAARAIERHLQTEYGYTLDLRAGGEQPLADFLFNVREGHCEYFATALAVMLRSQGIAARIVNGFQSGEYNDAAGAFIVTQKEAHTWVEVYFPENDAWVTFDPTPAAGRNLSAQQATGGFFLLKQISRYAEVFQMFWLQYVVAYDNREQRNLMRNLREHLIENQDRAETIWQTIRESFRDWWQNLNGARGAAKSFATAAQTFLVIAAIAVFALLNWFVYKRVDWRRLIAAFGFGKRAANERRAIEFYERMTAALAKRGLQRKASETPLEFAAVVNAPEAFKITEAYNRVRFGEQRLTRQEQHEIESWLAALESKNVNLSQLKTD